MTLRSTQGALFFLLAGIAIATQPTAAWSGDCGGAVACGCGDTVVADVTLTAHLDSCSGDGLTVVAGVLDCADRQISGSGDTSAFIGILVHGATGATVRNCRVRNFQDGIHVEGGSGNFILDNVVFSNRHGIWIGDSSDNDVDGNDVRDNSDEGIHIGTGASGNTVSNNEVHNNDGENLYLLHTSGNTITGNMIDDSKEAAIFIKHSSGNSFVANQIYRRPIAIRGDSAWNHFEGNVLAQGGFILKALEEDDVWSYPHHQTIEGGSIDASTCFQFLGSHDNTVSGVAVDTCRHKQEKEYGGLFPYGNVVSLNDGSPEDNGQGTGGSGSGGGRSGKIKFNSKEPEFDGLRAGYFFFAPGSDFDPSTETVEVELSDTDSVVYSLTLPPGTLQAKTSGYFLFNDKTASIIPGLRFLRFRNYGHDLWRLELRGRAELAGADNQSITFDWRIGDDEFTATDDWTEHRSGWELKNLAP